MGKDRAEREKRVGETEGRDRGGKQAERRQSEETSGRGKWEKEGGRCEGRRERGRAREKGAGSGLPAAERTALQAPAGCGPPAAPPRMPNSGLQGRPLPGGTEGPCPAGSTPACPGRRVPGAQPRSDPSGRRGSAAGLSGPGERTRERDGGGGGRRLRLRRSEAAPRRAGEESPASDAPRLARPALGGGSAGAGAELPAAGAYRCTAPPGQPRSAPRSARVGGRWEDVQARSPEPAGWVHTGEPSGPHASRSRSKGRARGEAGN